MPANPDQAAPKQPTWLEIVAANACSDNALQAAAPVEVPPAPEPLRLPVMGPTLASDSVSAIENCKKKIAARGFPNGFSSREQFVSAMSDLCATAASLNLIVRLTGVRGVAATFKSLSADKLGHYFDRNGNNTSDIDIFFVTDSLLAAPARPNRNGFIHPDRIAEAYPDLEAWNREWTERLGRDACAAALQSASPAMMEPHVPFLCGSKQT